MGTTGPSSSAWHGMPPERIESATGAAALIRATSALLRSTHGRTMQTSTSPGGSADPLASAREIRETFRNMAMNDEETVALTAGGHTFGKCHGAGDASKVGAEPEGADIAQQGLGWQSGHGCGMADDTITSGLEGAWTPTPIKWSDNYFRMLLDYDYELVTSPAGAKQWQPVNQKTEDMAPGAHSPDRRLP